MTDFTCKAAININTYTSTEMNTLCHTLLLLNLLEKKNNQRPLDQQQQTLTAAAYQKENREKNQLAMQKLFTAQRAAGCCGFSFK